MMPTYFKPLVAVALSLLILAGLAAESSRQQTLTQSTQASEPGAPSKSHPKKSIVYRNKQYGFTFNLPASWKGYSIMVGSWGGIVYGPTDAEAGEELGTEPKSTLEGPKITIRHPLWTGVNVHQDIPIMIFTKAQWRFAENGSLVVSAAPIGPSEIGRNSKYVFALPPRYDFGDAIGVQEVSDIISGHPLRAR
jgi:hypothetical protein